MINNMKANCLFFWLLIIGGLPQTNGLAQSRWVKGATLYSGHSYDHRPFLEQGETSEYRGRDNGFGLMLGRDLGQHFTIISGIHFVHRDISATTYRQDKTVFIDGFYSMNYLEVPLQVRYRLRSRNERWSPFVQAGLNFSRTVGGKGRIDFADSPSKVVGIGYDFIAGPLLGVGVEVRIADRAYLALQPTASIAYLSPSTWLYYPDTFLGLNLTFCYR